MRQPVVKILHDVGADRDVPLPSYESVGAAGADVRVNFPLDQRRDGLVLKTRTRALIPTGLRIEIPTGYEVQIRPRSGLALKHGIMLVNSPGTIDSDYRGPLGVIVVNTGDAPFPVRHGDRIAQLVVAPVVQAQFELADELGDTQRGADGFGSTGNI